MYTPEALRRISKVLMDPKADLSSVAQYAHFLQHPVEFDPMQRMELNLSTTGLALIAEDAARCAEDPIRTLRFAQAVYRATQDLLSTRDLPVQILYAGSGPFGTLALPTLMLLSAQQVQCTFLEWHETSVNHLQVAIDCLGLTQHTTTIEHTDATQWTFPEGYQPDIIVSETMQAGLRDEPQVAISRNLIKQCSKPVLMIPQDISLTLVGLSYAPDQGRFIIQEHLGLAFQCNAQTAIQPLTPRRIAYQTEKLSGANFIGISTELHLYQDLYLAPHDSGLTTPIVIDPIPQGHGPATISCQYETGASPQLHCHWE